MEENSTIKFARETLVSKVEGKFLDNYEILKQLGKGGYGKVYQVRNKRTGEIRACKHLSKLNIKNLEEFKREINFLMRLDHPNIIKLYEFFESESSLYMIMEECKGGPIFDRILQRTKGKKYSERDAANIFQQLMSCIQYCHNHNICHRDLKPDNILYLNPSSEKDNRIKVIDFGLSQYSNNLKTKFGTPYYVSPEILTGQYTQLCDVWSAGVILYILLSGDPPFNGQNDTIIYQKIMSMKFSFPEDKWKKISKEAKDLISHMLAPEKDRYTAEQVLNHPWFRKANNEPLTSLNFDTNVFLGYIQSSRMKKMALMYIASRLDENEINNLKNVFSAFDKTKDGQISYEELKQGLIQLKSNKITEQDVNNLFKTLDDKHNGKIDYNEFIAATLEEINYLRTNRLLEAFENFDKDNSGKISKDEFIMVLKAEKIEEKEIEQYIKVLDKNQDGKINYNEFLVLMQNQ